MTDGPALPTPSAGTSSSAMVVTRSGGFAGVNDVVEIAADGTAKVTSRTGGTRACTLDAAVVNQLRSFDLGAVGSGSSTIADGFNYEVRIDGGSASAGDGDKNKLRVAFASAAAAVVSACLASPAGSGAEEQ